MKSTIQIDLKTSSPEEAQKTLLDLCEQMQQEGLITGYRFEIETAAGPVSEKCVIAGEKVIA